MTPPPSIRGSFLALILAQAAHSIEEYSTRLYDVLPPAGAVSDLLGTDRRIGFAVFNAGLVAFGLWSFFGPVRRGSGAAIPLLWFWTLLEAGNGIAHITWALAARAYRPGLATAPILLGIALLLGGRLRRNAAGREAG